MPLRARKSFKLAPGLRVRTTGKSTSLQIGNRRARATVSKRGVGVGVSILPGLSWFKRLRRPKQADPEQGLRDATAGELFHEPDAVIVGLASGAIAATHTTRLRAMQELAIRRRARERS